VELVRNIRCKNSPLPDIHYKRLRPANNLLTAQNSRRVSVDPGVRSYFKVSNVAFLFIKRQNPCHLTDVTVQPIFIFQHLYECQNGFEGGRWFVGSDVLQVVDVGSYRLPQALTTTYGGFICKALLVRLNQPLLWSWSFQSTTEFLPDSKGEMESNGLSVD
jgi:hypothetical protein